jgi:hypothetical protein
VIALYHANWRDYDCCWKNRLTTSDCLIPRKLEIQILHVGTTEDCVHREYWGHWIRVRRVDFASSESKQRIQPQNCTAQPKLAAKDDIARQQARLSTLSLQESCHKIQGVNGLVIRD